MAEQYVPNLGHLCDESARRDAVHIAVAPVVAGVPLDPGDHVSVKDGIAFKPNNGRRCLGPGYMITTVGVVDPFYGGVIMKGERFWLFLYQNSVTSLRHVWSHPAFVAKAPEGFRVCERDMEERA